MEFFMKRLLLLSLIGLCWNIGLGNRIENAKREMLVPARLDLVRIEIFNSEQIKVLDNLGVIINQVRDNYCIAELTPDKINKLKKLGYHITILQENISGVYYNNFFTESEKGRYLTYTEFIDTMRVIATNNSTICKLETLGISHHGRLILGLKISDNPQIDEDEPAIYFDGAIHGDEKIAWAVGFELIKYIMNSYGFDPYINYLVANREIWIVPMLNPDGYVASSRYNGRSVDLNRNFGWMWGNEAYCGTDVFSENEATAFYNLFVKQPFVIYTSYHAGTIYISNPWSYTTHDSIPEKFLTWHLAQGYSSRYNNYPYGQGSIGMYPINGSSKDYTYGIQGEVSWSIELHHTKTPPAAVIETVFNINRDAILYLIYKTKQGIHGQVTDSATGEPLYAQIWFMPRNWLCYSSPTNGDFHRFYLPGTYSLIVRCPGYKVETIPVTVPNTADSSISLNIALIPDSTIVSNYGMRVVSTRYVATSTNRTYPVWALGSHDGVGYQLDNTKWIVVAMAKPIRNRIGNDFTIFRSSISGSATVKVSNNWKGPWLTVGTANAGQTSFDLVTAGLDSARYVRLAATSTFGFDAVEEYVAGSDIEEMENWKLQIKDFYCYPNIVSAQLKIFCDKTIKQDVKFGVYDVLGRNIKTFVLLAGERQISVNLKDWQNGIYFVKAEDVQGQARRFTIIR